MHFDIRGLSDLTKVVRGMNEKKEEPKPETPKVLEEKK